MKHPFQTLVLTITLSLTAAVQAQGVWRCGADGRSYSDSPCPGGRTLDVGPNRSAADAAAARADVQRQLAWAQASRAERERSEMQQLAASATPANLGPEPKKAAAKRPQNLKSPAKPPQRLTKRHRTEADGTWRATGPASRQTKG